MSGKFDLYHQYALQEAINCLSPSQEMINFCDGQFYIFPDDILCFFTLGEPPYTTYFRTPGILVWVPNQRYQVSSVEPTFLPSAILERRAKAGYEVCEIFVRWSNEEKFTYVGKAGFISCNYSNYEQQQGYVFFSISPELSNEVDNNYRTHKWGRINFNCCGNQRGQNGYFELESIEELVPYLKHMAECSSNDSATLDFRGGYLEFLTNQTSGTIRCLSENKHSINALYQEAPEAIEDFTYCGEYEGVPARAVISKTDALQAVDLYARTLKLADYVSWAEGIREEIV